MDSRIPCSDSDTIHDERAGPGKRMTGKTANGADLGCEYKHRVFRHGGPRHE